MTSWESWCGLLRPFNILGFVYTMAGDQRGFYECLKTVHGPMHHIQSPLRSSDGQTMFTDKVSILNRWSEHFLTLFSANRSVHETAINQIPQQPVLAELDTPPTFEETTKAIKQLKSRKAAGGDGTPAELWKHGGNAPQKSTQVLCLLLRGEQSTS